MEYQRVSEDARSLTGVAYMVAVSWDFRVDSRLRLFDSMSSLSMKYS